MVYESFLEKYVYTKTKKKKKKLEIIECFQNYLKHLFIHV